MTRPFVAAGPYVAADYASVIRVNDYVGLLIATVASRGHRR
jgi:hypothetical protein